MMRAIKPIVRSGGFTIIELMIVVVIVALLVALAVPAYKDYAARAKVTECINGAAIAKLHVSEYRQIMGPWPPTLADAGLNSNSGASQFCTGLADYTPGAGSFAIDVNETAIGITSGIVEPVLTPAEESTGILNWDCSIGNTSSFNVKYLPGSCKDS